MGLILRLAAQSLKSRVLTTWLTVTSIALSVTLLVGIEHLRAGVRESFAGTISGTDLIVGARGGTLQVLLSTVFGIGSPAGSVSMKTFERWKAHPAVKWAVPYSLGDSHRGFRVVGTTAEFYERYRYRKTGKVVFAQGHAAGADDEVVIGFDVAERLKYTLNSPVVVTHGLVDIGTSSHDSHPFHVVGILGRTFTPIDRSVYLTLEGLEAMHVEEPGRIVAAPNVAASTAAANAAASSATASSGAAPQSATAKPARKDASKPAGIDTSLATPGKSVPPVMPGATPPPMPGASPPPVMPGAEPPPEVAAAAAAAQKRADAQKAAQNAQPGARGTPPVMPGASPPPVMPGAEPPPEVAAAAAAAQKAATDKLAAQRQAAAQAATAKSVTAKSVTAQTPTAAPNAPAPRAGEAGHDHGDDQITAFFVGTKNRFEALMLQREMNTDFTEPLTAVIPGVALGELFQSIGSAEVGLRVVALFAVAIGLTGMLVALYSSLDARRREMAILRSVGAGPGTIVALLVIESGLLALLGCLIGVGLVYLGLVLGQGPIEQRFGLHLSIRVLQAPEYRYLALILASGVLVGFVPAWKAYRTSLADGLSPRA